MSGWIKLHRSIKKHWIMQREDYYRAWTLILLEVNHDDKKIPLGNDLVLCKRGESYRSLDSWCKLFACKWTIKKVRTFFKLLEVDNMIRRSKGTLTNGLSVVNYDIYQSKEDEEGRSRAEVGQKEGRSRATNKNDKNDKNDKKKEKTYRKKDFANKLASFKETYSRELLKAFYDYWTESGENDKKMRFEKQKSYDIKRRLATWKNRENKFNNNNQPERKTNNRDLTSQYGHYNKTDKYEHEKIEGFEPISPEDMAKIDNFPDL